MKNKFYSIERLVITTALFLLVLLVSPTSMHSQLKVKVDGKVVAGPDHTNDDLLNALAMSVFGHSSHEFRPGAKLAFGDFGRYTSYGWNVFIGEQGDTDTDKMWLHGKNGLYITCTGMPANTTASFNI